MGNLTQRWAQSGPFFPKWGHFFRFSKRAGKASPLPLSCAPLSVAEYTSISLNMPKYPWKCLNKLFWICHGSEYAWSSDMSDGLSKMRRVLNRPGFWIWHGFICMDCAEFRIRLNMAPYISIMPNMPEYALMPLNKLEHGRIMLNVLDIPENVWINYYGYVGVLSMPRYRCNNIVIIVANVILEFLSARFGAVLPFYHFLNRVEHKNNES